MAVRTTEQGAAEARVAALNLLAVGAAAFGSLDAVRVVNTSSRGPDGGRVYVLAGQVTDTIGNGFFAQDSILSVQGTTILNSKANGVFALASANQVTTVLVEDSVITGSIIDGVRLIALGSAIGSGTINALSALSASISASVRR